MTPNRRDPETASRSGKGTIHHLPPGLSMLPWELPRVFLGMDGAKATHGEAGTWLLPVPYEATASWGTDTRRGPQAIIDASRYVELYDQELGRDPSEGGVYTFPALELERGAADRAMAELERAFGLVLDAAAGRRVIMLGGEHSVSAPAILAHAARCDGRLAVLQMDAHLDLRDTFDGSPYSHACAMGRVVDVVDLVSVGVRGIGAEEWKVAQERENVAAFTGEAMAENDGWMDRALEALGDPVYLTFDVDFFDPSLVPSTGTPEPGGGTWRQATTFLRRVFAERRVVGADVVEHAPVPGLAAPDFLVAKLVYKIIGCWTEAEARPAASPRAP